MLSVHVEPRAIYTMQVTLIKHFLNESNNRIKLYFPGMAKKQISYQIHWICEIFVAMLLKIRNMEKVRGVPC